ncbi:bacteriohemerythrin [Candidatus Latescibacterota bacterium]
MTDQPAAPVTVWVRQLELGIPLIDGQHRKLVEHLDDLNRAVTAGRPMGEVSQCIDFLLQYTEEHFHTEEQFLAEKHYPGLEDHRKLHQTFRANVAKARRAVETRLEQKQSVDLVRSMVIHWYVEHIKGTDQQYATYLREKGLLKPAKT